MPSNPKVRHFVALVNKNPAGRDGQREEVAAVGHDPNGVTRKLRGVPRITGDCAIAVPLLRLAVVGKAFSGGYK
jgi:hypothetical protein